mmetsp:Transcript_54479/g.117947  ORF Transcript_54479/g.117947 Transcript_54479/m.117947 type:complete len:159 (+) Transcript_54479:45-521(+)
MESLFYRLYPPDAAVPDMVRLRPKYTPAGEEEQLPSDSAMSGALAGLAFMGAADETNEGGATSGSGAPTATPSAPSRPVGEAAPSEDLKRKLLEALSPEEAKQDDLSALSVKQLKQRISEAGLTLPAGVAEKSELVTFLRQNTTAEAPAKAAKVTARG